jgi:uncharacterized protein (DUF302 family)
MTFTFNKTTHHDFDDAVKLVTEELKKEGFGVITEIDLKEKFKEKLGVDFSNYKILGACNPALAYKAIQIEPNIGTMLPCNVLVHENKEGKVEIAAINPLSSMGAIDNADLTALAEDVSEKLKAVIDRIR